MGKKKNKKKVKEGQNMVHIARTCTPKVSLEQSLQEMTLIRKGKIAKRSWQDLRKDVENEDLQEE